jgi:cell division protein ZapD
MRDAGQRGADLQTWVRPLTQFSSAMAIVLRLLRETAHRSKQVAATGAFQQTLQGRTYALLQVRVASDVSAIPEISANKYMLWIRFSAADRDLKPKPLDRDVPFELSLCAF